MLDAYDASKVVAPRNESLQSQGGPTPAITFSPDLSMVAYLTDPSNPYIIKTAALRGDFSGSREDEKVAIHSSDLRLGNSQFIVSAAFSSDSPKLATYLNDGRLWIWNLEPKLGASEVWNSLNESMRLESLAASSFVGLNITGRPVGEHYAPGPRHVIQLWKPNALIAVSSNEWRLTKTESKEKGQTLQADRVVLKNDSLVSAPSTSNFGAYRANTFSAKPNEIFSDNGQYLYTQFDKQSFIIQDFYTGKKVMRHINRGEISFAAFRPVTRQIFVFAHDTDETIKDRRFYIYVFSLRDHGSHKRPGQGYDLAAHPLSVYTRKMINGQRWIYDAKFNDIGSKLGIVLYEKLTGVHQIRIFDTFPEGHVKLNSSAQAFMNELKNLNGEQNVEKRGVVEDYAGIAKLASALRAEQEKNAFLKARLDALEAQKDDDRKKIHSLKEQLKNEQSVSEQLQQRRVADRQTIESLKEQIRLLHTSQDDQHGLAVPSSAWGAGCSDLLKSRRQF